MTFDLKSYLNRHRILIDDQLKLIFNPLDENRTLIKAMKYSLLAGGKRVRPILSMAAARACGKKDETALLAGCAIEMIHTYSLIHDDLPSMDDDDLRRGVPTCHKQFSEPAAILAGDALLTHAFEILASPAPYFKIYPDTPARLKLVHEIAQACGTNGMVEGQMLDMQLTDPQISDPLDHLKTIHHLKTGRMITVSVKAGAISCNADKKQTDQLIQYADFIGLAFQVADDILNVEGDPEIMGKAAGSDEINDKMTYPATIGLEQSKVFARQLVADAMDAVSSFDDNAAPLRAIAQYIIDRKR